MTIDALVKRIRELEDELDRTIDETRQQFQYEIRNKRVRFEQAVRQRHRAFKTGIFRYLIERGFLAMLFAPVVYALIFPLVLLDIFGTVFQFICFPVYGIKKVKRSDFIALDRHHLAYLNAFEKLNCVYCSYANGLLAYAREIAGRAEEHWCPIKHARRIKGRHQYYWTFAEYGDAEGFLNKESEVANTSLAQNKKHWKSSKSDEE